jgi:prepilin-type N-terminal cleavage/methylation domain-containing protein/prepilin-type processing-associated H-X9-DG protein
MTRRGLTLVELLIVFSIISFLLAVAFPALLSVRNQAQGAVCTQNSGTLVIAWLLFKDDNDDRLVGGSAGSDPGAWVASPVGSGLEGERLGIVHGALFSYVEKVEAYRCPADERRQTAFRSYSIAGGANGDTWKTSYVRAERYSQLVRPSSKYVFVEEADPKTWNDGSWVMDVRGRSWVDPLAIWHNGSRSSLAYADGHAGIHAWVDTSTVEMSAKRRPLFPVSAGEGEDLQFMISGFPQGTSETSGP